jgi:hypothetical protein
MTSNNVLKYPGSGAYAQAFSSTGHYPHDQLHQQAFAMQERAMRL